MGTDRVCVGVNRVGAWMLCERMQSVRTLTFSGNLGFGRKQKNPRQNCLEKKPEFYAIIPAAGCQKHRHVYHRSKHRQQANTVHTSRPGASWEGVWDVSSSCENHRK